MNVLQVITALHKGGAEAHLLLLAKGLKSRGATCEVAFLRSAVPGGSIDLRPAFEEAGIRTHYLGCENPYDPRSGLRLRRLLATRRWDILHSHLPRADAAAALAKLLSPRVTWVSTLHDPYDAEYSGARLIPLLAPMWRLTDGMIAVSESLRRWSVGRLGVRPDAVRTITHGVELQTRRTSKAAPDATHDDPGHRIGSLGRYEERKNHETLIRAMVPVLKRFPDARLRIAGHDPLGYGSVLRRLIAELNLAEQVHLDGFISDRDEFFSQIDVFALASLWEGFGVVVLEAMAAGKPPVVSDVAPLNEIVEPGRSGLVAEPGNPDSFAAALISLFSDPDCLRTMAAEGRRRVETEFSLERMVEQTMEYYVEVIGRRPGWARRGDRRVPAVSPTPAEPNPGVNYDAPTVAGFGREWQRFDQRSLGEAEAFNLFNRYFAIFPWEALPAGARGLDAGCGSGRWARFVAPRVGQLLCVDASADALGVARMNLSGQGNCEFHLATIDSMPGEDGSLDFAYALGVLHHIPDTVSALCACVRKLKPGAPFLVYLYYRFDNRPPWFPKIWKISDYLRRLISRCPFAVRNAVTALLALLVYWPLARASKVAERLGAAVDNVPLSAYRDVSFYVMRTDALDRFGTRLEKRFTREEIRGMMEEAGLSEICFHDGPPYWVAVGRRRL